MKARWLAAAALPLLAGTALAATTATTTYARQDRHARYGYGGAQIAFGGSKVWTQCGLGVGWRMADGTTRQVTAGHCFPSGATRALYHDLSGATVGYVKTVRYGGGRDWLLLSGRSTQYAYLGGTATKTLIRLDGFESPETGQQVCVSGGRRGTSCGWTVTRLIHAYDLHHADLGVQTEARHSLVNGKCPADSGDSGSTVYRQTSDGTWFQGLMSTGQVGSTYCTMGFVSVGTLMNQIGGTPVTRATP